MASTLLCLGFDQLCCVHGVFLTCIDSRQDSVSLEQERDAETETKVFNLDRKAEVEKN